MRPALHLGAALAALLIGSPPARADHGGAHCRTRDRACLIEAAATYIHALASGDAQSIRLAPNVWRVELGHQNISNEEEMRENMAGQCRFTAEVFHERWYVDELLGEAVVFYDLKADMRGEECGPPTLPRELQVGTWIAERFRVLDGLIYEVEPTFFIDGPGATCTIPERRDTDFGPFGCGDNSRECAIETANKYVDAQLSHDASQVPLAPDAWRLENCKNIGNSADEIRLVLTAPDTTVDLTHRRWFVEGENLVVFYFLWTHPSGDPNTPRSEQQAYFHAERFRVDDGLIKEVELIFWPGQAALGGAGYEFPDQDGDGLQHVDDNCPDAANPGQEDGGGLDTAEPDGTGDACQCGDVTGDGVVNGQDGVVITRYGLGVEPNPLFAVPGNCDVAGNGVCNGQDGYFVTRAALGLGPNGFLFGPHCPNADPSVPCPDCP